MSTTPRKQRAYDHRLPELMQRTGGFQLASRHGVPASTARGWLNKSATAVVSLDVLDHDTLPLQYELIQLRRRVMVNSDATHLICNVAIRREEMSTML